MKKTLSLSIVLFLVFFLTNCCNEGYIFLKTPDDITLYTGEMFQVEATSNQVIYFESEDDFTASVLADGLIRANHVGETEIRLMNSNDLIEVRVNVAPRYRLYETPVITSWYHNRYEIEDMFGYPDFEDEYGMIYGNYTRAVEELIFEFDRFDRLEMYTLVIDRDYPSVEIVEFLEERYEYDSTDDGVTLYTDRKEHREITSVIGLGYTVSGHWTITYIPFYDTKETDLEALREKVVTKLK